MISLQKRQIAGIKQMINFNQPVRLNSGEVQWKVLIYDQHGQDIISPVLSVADLRQLGVTLHLMIENRREQVDEVPAVYFIKPNEHSLKLLTQDLSTHLYESFYLNFSSTISRDALEDLASSAARADAVRHIVNLCDQYLNFISLEDHAFVLSAGCPHAPPGAPSLSQPAVKHGQMSYYALNSKKATDSDLKQAVDEIVDGLFAVCATLGTVPIIRCPGGNAAEMVCQRLDQRLRDALRDPKSPFTTSFVSAATDSGESSASHLSFQRPLLVVLDRDVDIATMLRHSWTYQSMAHDLLGMRQNRVDVEDDGPSVSGRRKMLQYDFGPSDVYWPKLKGLIFPVVTEQIHLANEHHKQKKDGEKQRIKAQLGITSGGDDELTALAAAEGGSSSMSSTLSSAMASLPQLLANERSLEAHTNVLSALLNVIKARSIDALVETEDKLLGRPAQATDVTAALTAHSQALLDDRLRLLMLSLLVVADASPSSAGSKEIEQHESALRDAGVDVSGMKYIRELRIRHQVSSAVGGGGMSSKPSVGGGLDSMMTKMGQSVIDGVRTLVVRKEKLPVTRIVDHLVKHKQNSELVSNYRLYDPKLLKAAESANSLGTKRAMQPFTDAIVFVVGGGNFVEFQNLVDSFQPQSSQTLQPGTTLVEATSAMGKSNISAVDPALGPSMKNLFYGATEMSDPSSFVKQLNLLGKEEET